VADSPKPPEAPADKPVDKPSEPLPHASPALAKLPDPPTTATQDWVSGTQRQQRGSARNPGRNRRSCHRKPDQSMAAISTVRRTRNPNYFDGGEFRCNNSIVSAPVVESAAAPIAGHGVPEIIPIGVTGSRGKSSPTRAVAWVGVGPCNLHSIGWHWHRVLTADGMR